MLDLEYNGHILNERTLNRDPQPYLEELPEWNRGLAQRAAAEEGLELSEQHWEVLHYLRRRFVTQGQVRYARQLSRELEAQFEDRGGSRLLYRLFPGGPVTQGCRIAGIPAPDYHADLSFGSVE